MGNFQGRYISWEGGHALQRCAERGKSPTEVESVIRESRHLEQRADGRWTIDGCIDGEVTRIIVAEAREDALVVVTVYGRGIRCS